MAHLAADHTVRIHAGRDEHHVLDGPCHHAVPGPEGRDHSNLGVRHGAEDHAGCFSAHCQHAGQISHSISHRRITAQPAKQIIGHHPASEKHMRSGQHLSGCHADQPS